MDFHDYNRSERFLWVGWTKRNLNTHNSFAIFVLFSRSLSHFKRIKKSTKWITIYGDVGRFRHYRHTPQTQAYTNSFQCLWIKLFNRFTQSIYAIRCRPLPSIHQIHSHINHKAMFKVSYAAYNRNESLLEYSVVK